MNGGSKDESQSQLRLYCSKDESQSQLRLYGSKDESQSQLRLYGRRQNAVRQNAVRGAGRPPFNSAVGQHNVVDVNRIRQGLDVRTTVSSFKQALGYLLI